jgi:5-methylcytosine-specific restriction endonuclease McrA
MFILCTLYSCAWLFSRSPIVVYEDYIRSSRWREKARDCKSRAGWRCARCGSTENLQAHHKTYARLGRERPTDLECLCDGCHETEHQLLVT